MILDFVDLIQSEISNFVVKKMQKNFFVKIFFKQNKIPKDFFTLTEQTSSMVFIQEKKEKEI